MDNTNIQLQDDGWRWLERPDVSHLPYFKPINKGIVGAAEADEARDAKKMVSIFVLANKEHVNLPHIVTRLQDIFRESGEQFELLVMDEGNFFMNTKEYLRGVADQLPLRVIEPAVPGRLTIEDLKKAKGDRLVVFDADLHLSPNAVIEMLSLLQTNDVAFSKWSLSHMPWYRAAQTICSKALFLPFMPLLVGVPRPVLRAYRREVLRKLEQCRRFRQVASFDAQAVFFSKRVGLRVAYVNAVLESGILFGWTSRVVKRQFLSLQTIYVLRAILATEFIMPFLFPPTKAEYSATGFTNVQDYLFLSETESAKQHITKETIALFCWFCVGVGLYLVAMSAWLDQSVFRVILGTLSFAYLSLLFIKLYVTKRSLTHSYLRISPEELKTLEPNDLPVITILIPLYMEREIIPQIFRRLSDLDYPTEKLDIIFILESTDKETIAGFLAANPPAHFKALLSPDVLPKTKPKALNVAFQKSRGEIVVIFDAEVLPELDQLKKACFAFKKYPNVMFIHTRLSVYNAAYNWLTKLYTAEFSFFYDYFLNGLVSMNLPLPISGHSIYFRRQVIEKVGGWDPYNVAEDCDIGIRIFRHGFGSGLMIDSFAWEQSTTTLSTWVPQRTRWFKGFLQTSMVHLRYPLLLKNDLGGWRNFLWFLILVPGTTLVNALNLIQTIFLLLWFVTHSVYIEEQYEGLPIYMAVITCIVGNYLFTYFNLLGLYNRKNYSVMLTAYLSPLYWMMLGYATFKSVVEFLVAPYKWNKTTHSSASPN